MDSFATLWPRSHTSDHSIPQEYNSEVDKLTNSRAMENLLSLLKSTSWFTYYQFPPSAPPNNISTLFLHLSLFTTLSQDGPQPYTYPPSHLYQPCPLPSCSKHQGPRCWIFVNTHIWKKLGEDHQDDISCGIYLTTKFLSFCYIPMIKLINSEIQRIIQQQDTAKDLDVG